MPLQPFQRIYNIADFGITADVVFAKSMWNKVGAVTVPAQQKVTWGHGGTGGGVDTRGQAYLKMCIGTTTFAVGKIRLALANANETQIVVVAEERTERFQADESDRNKCVLLGEYPTKAQEDSKLMIFYYMDATSAQTFEYAGTNSKFLLPVTVYQ